MSDERIEIPGLPDKWKLIHCTATNNDLPDSPFSKWKDADVLNLLREIAQLTAEIETAKQDRNMYDSAHKREAVASLRLAAELVDVKAERDAALRECEEARKTAEYWKAEHLAGNEVIERLEAPVSDEEWGKGCHLANRSHVNNIIANRSKPPDEPNA